MPLQSDPLLVFRGSTSSYGLYARRHWLGEGSALDRRIDERLDATLNAQASDGSWNGSAVETIGGLVTLELLGDPDEPAAVHAVDWLLERHRPVTLYQEAGGGQSYAVGLFSEVSDADAERLQKGSDLPFTPGCPTHVKTAAALYFAGVYDRDIEGRVGRAFRTLGRICQKSGGRFCENLTCSHNVLRAFVCYPDTEDHPVTEEALGHLASVQHPDGAWEASEALYHFVNTAARSQSDVTDAIFERALPLLERSQNPDGSWGDERKELSTFLAVEALKRREVLE